MKLLVIAFFLVPLLDQTGASPIQTTEVDQFDKDVSEI